MPVIENMKSYMVSVYLFEECQDTIGIDDSKYEILSVIPFWKWVAVCKYSY